MCSNWSKWQIILNCLENPFLVCYVPDSGASQEYGCIKKLDDNGQVCVAGIVPKSSSVNQVGRLFLSQFKEVRKKVSSSHTERAGTAQRVESLSHKVKGLSGMWFQRKSPSRDCLIGN